MTVSAVLAATEPTAQIEGWLEELIEARCKLAAVRDAVLKEVADTLRNQRRARRNLIAAVERAQRLLAADEGQRPAPNLLLGLMEESLQKAGADHAAAVATAMAFLTGPLGLSEEEAQRKIAEACQTA